MNPYPRMLRRQWSPRATRYAFALVLASYLGREQSLWSQPASPVSSPVQASPWRGLHVWLDRKEAAKELEDTLPRLAQNGVNTIVAEVNYSFEFLQHPELRNPHFITRSAASSLADHAARCGIRLIPEFNCLGHQSFGRRIEPLLRMHPEFNEAPSLALTNPSVYCLEWCPQAPGLDALVFSLIDELADVFRADAVHVGMDEVYLGGLGECDRCRGKNPARLFARQVNALHGHIVGERHLQMLMWADRLIGVKFQGHSKYDNAGNDLSAALDWIPKNVILCDWHYEQRPAYPSVPFLAAHGFRVWPSGFMPLKAAAAFSDFSMAQTNREIIGWLVTTWNATNITHLPDWPPLKEILPRWKTKPL